MPIEAMRNRKPRLVTTVQNALLELPLGARTTRRTTAAVANDFSCRRSSPTDPVNRTTAAATHAPTATAMVTGTRAGWEVLVGLEGPDHAGGAATTKAPVSPGTATARTHAN